MLYVWLTIALALSVPLPGQVSGRIRVTKPLTKKRISLPQVYERNAAIPTPAAEPEDELRRVVVYVDSTSLSANPAEATMDQRGRRFEPEVVAVPAGSTIAFPNSDPIFHNVFSLSKVKQFDLGNYNAGEVRKVTFTEPGLVQLHCHLHPGMNGAIMVTPNNWYALPDRTGDFHLPRLPPGNYTLVAWHKSAGYFRRSIEVRAGKPVVVDFEIPLLHAAVRQ
jgi:plastocyanin